MLIKQRQHPSTTGQTPIIPSRRWDANTSLAAHDMHSVLCTVVDNMIWRRMTIRQCTSESDSSVVPVAPHRQGKQLDRIHKSCNQPAQTTFMQFQAC